MRYFCLLVALALANPALADPTPRPADLARLQSEEAAFGRAVKQALMAGLATDIPVLLEVMRGAPRDLAPDGDWNCRMLKLGNTSPLIVYPDFRCRITGTAPDTWRIEKLTGSQRLQGEITLTEGRGLYLGVGYVGPAPSGNYASLPPDDQTPVYPGQTNAQVGCLEQMGPDRARLMLPAPLLESDFDILYLTR